MSLKNSAALKSASPYSAVLTREQFLFYEVRTTARLMADGLNDTEVIDRIVTDKSALQYQRAVLRWQQSENRRPLHGVCECRTVPSDVQISL